MTETAKPHQPITAAFAKAFPETVAITLNMLAAKCDEYKAEIEKLKVVAENVLLRKFLDSAANEGLVLDVVCAADLYMSIYELLPKNK